MCRSKSKFVKVSQHNNNPCTESESNREEAIVEALVRRELSNSMNLSVQLRRNTAIDRVVDRKC